MISICQHLTLGLRSYHVSHARDVYLCVYSVQCSISIRTIVSIDIEMSYLQLLKHKTKFRRSQPNYGYIVLEELYTGNMD